MRLAYNILFSLVLVGIKPRVLLIQNKCSILELYLSPCLIRLSHFYQVIYTKFSVIQILLYKIISFLRFRKIKKFTTIYFPLLYITTLFNFIIFCN